VQVGYHIELLLAFVLSFRRPFSDELGARPVGDSIFPITMAAVMSGLHSVAVTWPKSALFSVYLNTDSSLSGKFQAKVIHQPEGETQSTRSFWMAAMSLAADSNEVLHSEVLYRGSENGERNDLSLWIFSSYSKA
jgi:hypothetical protein